MTAASLAVDVSPRDEEANVWVRVIAFCEFAELLARHAKGDTLAASGRPELQHWTADDGPSCFQAVFRHELLRFSHLATGSQMVDESEKRTAWWMSVADPRRTLQYSDNGGAK